MEVFPMHAIGNVDALSNPLPSFPTSLLHARWRNAGGAGGGYNKRKVSQPAGRASIQTWGEEGWLPSW